MSDQSKTTPPSRTVPPMTGPKPIRDVKPLPPSEETSGASPPVMIREAPTSTERYQAVPSRESTYQVVLEEVSQNTGRKRWLSNSQKLRVGRTSEADFSFPRDLSMSHLHFVLECDADACHLNDLGSCNGTLVNDVPVRSTILRDRDMIRAGDTEFCVRIHGGLQPSEQDIAAHTAADFVHQGSSNAKLVFEREVLPNGLLCASGEAAACDPAVVAEHLNGQWPIHFIVDLAKVNLDIPDDMRTTNRLMDWLPVAEGIPTPVLLSAMDCPNIAAMVGQAWGCDALICLFTELGTNDLTQVLRAGVRGERVQDVLTEHPDHVVGIYIPTILEQVLRTNPEDKLAEVFPGVEAVLLENKSGWELFMPVANEQRLQLIGLSATIPDPPVNTELSDA